MTTVFQSEIHAIEKCTQDDIDRGYEIEQYLIVQLPKSKHQDDTNSMEHLHICYGMLLCLTFKSVFYPQKMH